MSPSRDELIQKIQDLDNLIALADANAVNPHLHGLERRKSKRAAEEARRQRDGLMMAFAWGET